MLFRSGAGTPCYFYYGRFNFETPLSDQAEIEAFSLDGQEGTIDQENRTIAVKVPKGMDLSSVTPEIILSKGATLQSPMLPVTLVDGVEQAFVVMAEDGKTMNVYKVTVTGDETVDGKGTQIVMDSLELEDASILKDVELLGYTEEETEDGVNIILKVGSATDITALLLKAKLSYGATVSPSVLDGKTKLDLSDWNTITVTSQSGIKKVYHIRAEKKPVAAMLEAVSVFCLPSSREMKLPLPWPKKKPTAWITAIMENTTPTAPVAALLRSIPTKKVSAML